MSNTSYVEDYNAIVAVLDAYNAGCALADSSVMRPCFAHESTMFGVSEEMLKGGQIQCLFDTIDGFEPSPNAKAVIGRIDIVGTAANARVDTNDLVGIRVTDFLNLLKIDGRWIIVGKVYHIHTSD